MGIIHPSWWREFLPPIAEEAWPEAAHENAHKALQILNTCFRKNKLNSVKEGSTSSGSSSCTVEPVLSYDKLEDQQCMLSMLCCSVP